MKQLVSQKLEWFPSDHEWHVRLSVERQPHASMCRVVMRRKPNFAHVLHGSAIRRGKTRLSSILRCMTDLAVHHSGAGKNWFVSAAGGSVQ